MANVPLVSHLPPVDPGPPTDGRPPAGEDHPMRVVTRAAATGRSGWSDERRAHVNELFDGLAGEWHTRAVPGRGDPLVDALLRGGVAGAGLGLELGSGTGIVSHAVGEHFDRAIAVDLSMEMLRRAPTAPPRMRADGSSLPVPDGALAALILMNMLLFPEEADRVLADDGVLVWVNSRGAETPIHLPAEDVVAALPGAWTGVASGHGTATWCVARRAS